MKQNHKIAVFIVVVAAVVAIAGYVARGRIVSLFYQTTATSLQPGMDLGSGRDIGYEVIATDLEIPWEIVFLADGDLLVTERGGTLKRIGRQGQVYTIDGVEHVGEGGLLGMALHPQFSDNRWLYLYLTTRTGEGLTNRVQRYRYENDVLMEKETIIDGIPGAAYHDGGRIAFGPDGYLYITTGDAGDEEQAQQVASLAGKILRVGDDGSIPEGNPFASPVYSYGHRNPQGLAWDSRNRLWATEHGRSGLRSGFDEINLIQPGQNYGWPVIQGDETRPGMERPVAHSGPDETWAPAGVAFWSGMLLFGGLRGESLYQARIVSERGLELTAHFRGDFGRMRVVVRGPGESLYIATSNTDGRGSPRANDDRIIRLPLSQFGEG